VFFRFFVKATSIFLLASSLVFSPAPVLALDFDFPTRLIGSGKANALAPEWEQINFASLPPVQSSGSAAGHTWTTGQTLPEILTLGDISPALSVELLTPGAIAQDTQLDSTQVALSSFPLVGEQTLTDLASAVPQLGQTSVGDIPPVAGLLKAKGLPGLENQPLANVLASSPQIGDFKLGDIDLSEFPLSSIPNLEATELRQFSGWDKSLIQDVPGLSSLPLANFPNPVAALGSMVMRIDTIYGTAESRRHNTISGSNVDGFQVPCDKNCAHVELDNLENVGRSQQSPLEGKQWISGKYQKVNGGSGCLAWVNGGKEPTGRHPFGKTFKVVVMEPDETTDTVDTALYFRFASFCGATPYILGPVPFFSYHINSPIFVGLLNSGAAVSSLQSNFSGLATAQQASPGSTTPGVAPTVVPSSYQPQLQSGKLGLVQGVNLEKLMQAVNPEETEDYNTVGTYGCDAGAANCGRTLGKYQLNSYDSTVVAAISAKPNGAEFLAKLQNKNYNPTASELAEYFPPADQDTLLRQGLASKLTTTSKQTDPSTNQPFTGSRLIERVVQKYLGGDYSKVDGAGSDEQGQLTLSGYGKQTLQRYVASGGALPSADITVVPSTTPATTAAANQKITGAIARLGNFSVGGSPGTGTMVAVNKVITTAGLKPLANGTKSVEQGLQALRDGRGEVVSQQRSQPGDLVFFDAGGVKQVAGICATEGCSSYRVASGLEGGKFTVMPANKLTGKGAPFEGKSPAIFRLKN